MKATGICRLFKREDLYEFLFRLPVALNSIGPVERWLLREKLLDYEFKGRHFVLTLEEVVMHFGIEVTDHYINYRPREEFLKSVGHSISIAMLVGIFGGFSVLAPEEDEDGSKRMSGQEHAPEITPELLAKAEFFAKDTMKFVPETIFSDENLNIAEKERQLEKRRYRIKNLPVFNMKKIPQKIIHEWISYAFKPEYAKKYLGDKEAFDQKIRPLVYLAWLIAHDLLIINGIETCETEGVVLNYDDYELPGGGYRLDQTIEEYQLEELALQLKGKY